MSRAADTMSPTQLSAKILRTYLDFGVVSGHFHRGGMPAGRRASGRCERRAHEEGLRTEHKAGESENPSEHHRDGEVEWRERRERDVAPRTRREGERCTCAAKKNVLVGSSVIW